MNSLEAIRSAFKMGRVKWRLHALSRILERGITRDMVSEVVLKGEIIETYSANKPFPSHLVFGFAAERVLHAVIAVDRESGIAYVVTVYEPDLEHFEADFKTRRNKR